MATVEARPKLSPEQYLAEERNAGEWHEYYDGETVERPRSSLSHCQITTNLAREIHTQLQNRPEEVYAVNMRVSTDPKRTFVYPDVVAVRDEPQCLDHELDTLLNPVMVVEVLSPATEVRDRGWKFDRYRRCETLEEFVLVAQDRMRVEHWVRRGEEWVLTILERREDVLRLGSLGCDVVLSEIYAKVMFSRQGTNDGG